MIKQCPSCKAINKPDSDFCNTCGADIKDVAAQPMSAPPPPPYNFPQQPPIAPGFIPSSQSKISWGDVCTMVGFVASLLGILFFSVILLPLGCVMSIIGFKSNRTKSIAVAGIVISIVAILIKVGVTLYDYHLIPHWVTSGIFG